MYFTWNSARSRDQNSSLSLPKWGPSGQLYGTIHLLRYTQKTIVACTCTHICACMHIYTHWLVGFRYQRRSRRRKKALSHFRSIAWWLGHLPKKWKVQILLGFLHLGRVEPASPVSQHRSIGHVTGWALSKMSSPCRCLPGQLKERDMWGQEEENKLDGVWLGEVDATGFWVLAYVLAPTEVEDSPPISIHFYWVAVRCTV